MGADYKGEERAIAEINALSHEAKKWLCHHLGNSLNVVTGSLELAKIVPAKDITGYIDQALKGAWHIVDDLHKSGIRNTRR